MTDQIHVVCPHCGGLNRLPAQRLAEGGKCGRCREPLFSARPLEVNAAAFERHLSKSDLPLLVDFWAPWCGPCRVMGPAFEQAAAALEPAVRLLKVNTEAEQSLAGRFNIRSIPTLALFHRGREIARQAGAMDAANIQAWTRQQLSR